MRYMVCEDTVEAIIREQCSPMVADHLVSKIRMIPGKADVYCKICEYAEIETVSHSVVCRHKRGLIDPDLYTSCSFGCTRR